jgi:hypothetical protein
MLSKTQLAAKRELYRRDYLSFAAEQLKIKSIRPGEMLPLLLNDGQKILHNKTEAQRKELGYVRAVLLKGRQLGGSTYGQSRLFTATVTTRNFNTLLIALDEASTSKIFDISRTFYDFMGDEFRPMLRMSNKRELVFENPNKKERGLNQGLKSRMDFQQASQVNAGTGTTRQGLHLSELAKWREEDIKILMSSLMPTIHHVDDTFVIFESTAYVYGDHFREMCDRARGNKSEYIFCFVPWWLDAKNMIRLQPDEKISPDHDEKFLIKLAGKGQPKDDIPPHTMLPEQLKWRRAQMVELGEMFDQEYPYDFESAWVSLDAAVFNRNIMYEMRQALMPPPEFAIIDPKGRLLTNKVSGDVHSDEDYIAIWQQPIPGVQYDIGADPSNGIPGADWSCAQVIRRDTHEQVAEYHKCIGAVDLGTDLYWLGKHYNTAHLAIEMTGPGYNTSDQLHKMYYPELYRWRNRDRSVQTFSQLTGWKTQRDSKHLMVTRTQHMLNHRQLIVHSKCLWQEMHDFCRVGPEDYRGSGHDDLVISYCITIQVAEDESAGVPSAPPPLVPDAPMSGPHLHDTRIPGQARSNDTYQSILREMRGE